MSSSTPVDDGGGVKGRTDVFRLAAVWIALASGCSEAGGPAERSDGAVPAGPAPTEIATPPTAAAGSTAVERDAVPATERRAGSQVLGKKDLTLRGAPACEIRFVYAGREAEELFWEEACAAVTAAMLTRRELEALGRWERLDSFARKFVAALPGGRVLYVEGGASASVYPVGTTGSTYEAPVAD